MDRDRLLRDLQRAAAICDEADPYGAGVARAYRVVVACIKDGLYDQSADPFDPPGDHIIDHTIHLASWEQELASLAPLTDLFVDGHPPSATEGPGEGIRPT